MKPTHIYYASSDFFRVMGQATAEIQPGRWVPARPLGSRRSVIMRFWAAWRVFIGKADALVWIGQ